MIRIQHDDFDPGAEQQALEMEATGLGAICTFTGLVRDHGDQQDVEGLFLEHYPGMTERALEAVVADAFSRWELLDCRIIHRVGMLRMGERIVFVGVASAHRRDAFAACEFVMDALKVSAPFWKKELTAEGDHWVEQKGDDRSRAQRWSKPTSDTR